MGTTLVEKKNPKSQVWGSVHESVERFDELELPVDPAQNKLGPGSLIMKVAGEEIYSLLLKHMGEQGYQEGVDLFLFPYDWRLSNFITAERLREFIQSNGLAGRQIDLIGHSMGGLVALIYIHKFPQDAAQVRNFVSMGTPYFGAIGAIRALAEGFQAVGVKNEQVVPAGNVSLVYRVFSSIDSIYELLPMYGGCCYEVVDGADDPEEWNVFEARIWEAIGLYLEDRSRRKGHKLHLDQAFARVVELAQLVQTPMPPHIQRIAIYATNAEKTPLRMIANGRGSRKHLWQVSENAGDGTVLAFSATGGLPENAVLIESSKKHQVLFDDPAVWQALAPHLQR